MLLRFCAQIVKFLKKILYILLIVFVCPTFFAQAQKKPRIENLPKYDIRPYHFGFLLGVNKMDFVIKNSAQIDTANPIMTIKSDPQFGFNIGIVSDLKLGSHFDLRFIPGLSFGERRLEYNLRNDSGIVTALKKIESTFIDFPLVLKYKSARLTNTRAYVISGIKYSIDLASQAGKKDQNNNDLVKLKRNDWSTEFGVGFDFYLEYFKFSVEIKMAYGIRDLLVRDDTPYTSSINRLNSKITLISFLFE